MAKFKIQKSFGIDNGELDGLSPQQVFCLGYELADIDGRLRYDPRAIENKPVHSDNEKRIRASLENSGRLYKLTWLNDDWLRLDVWPVMAAPENPSNAEEDAGEDRHSGNGVGLVVLLSFGLALAVALVVLYSIICPVQVPVP